VGDVGWTFLSGVPVKIRFNRPALCGQEAAYIAEALCSGHLSGNGPFTRRCHDHIERATGSSRVLLTQSCTAALEMCALLLDLEPGDEVILPSYTFVTSASAFALRGAVPIFVDIDPRTQNIDPEQAKAAITRRTRAIVAVHYAGVACDMAALLALAQERSLKLIEDAAQAVEARWCGRALGSIGQLGTYSFHDSKNIHCGEGGALLINDPELIARAEILWEKGTNRSAFFRHEVDKYTWVDLGSSFLPSELSAAFLLAQLEAAEVITAVRLDIWQRYHAALEPLERAEQLVRPHIPNEASHNAHMYYVVLPSAQARNEVIWQLREQGIEAFFHYVPLHSSPAGQRYGRPARALPVTERAGARLLRLPLWQGMTGEPEWVAAALKEALAA
jgi:dTDP-4-amino-4,6-dideoxygalactose transaminase